MKEFVAKDPDAVDGVCPVNKNTAPDHQEKDREIDPVEPSNGEQMFFFEFFCHFSVFNELKFEKDP